MTGNPTGAPSSSRTLSRPGWDALLLAILVFALLQITGLAEAGVLPNRVADVLQHPLLGNILPTSGEQAFGDTGPRPGDPIGLTLIAITLGLLLLYFVIDLSLQEKRQSQVKWILMVGILLSMVFLPTTKLILLRQQSGPASYTHDGGVIQTEAAINFFVHGQNPYTLDYTDTPMAEWGFNRYRTALYHYPYLPWTFVFSSPFYLMGQATGSYDQRWIYMLLLAIALALAPRLAGTTKAKLALVAVLGLNPIMALDVIFGQNDSFVLSWLVISLVAYSIWRQGNANGARPVWALRLSTISFGLACASKPTAWFMAPFYLLLLVYDELAQRPVTWTSLVQIIPAMIRRGWLAAAAFLILILPYVLWDFGSLYDDVWRWSSGKGDTGYQIWGWGASNFILAFGWVEDRFSSWPFWMIEIAVAFPLLLWFIRRQQRSCTIANACWHYGILLLGFFYGSRFLNENYLGYILAFLAIGIFSEVHGLRDEDYAPSISISSSTSG